jgi:hypothetical protein
MRSAMLTRFRFVFGSILPGRVGTSPAPDHAIATGMAKGPQVPYADQLHVVTRGTRAHPPDDTYALDGFNKETRSVFTNFFVSGTDERFDD